MVVSIIILIISLFLDGILSNFLPFMVGDLSLFTPMFSIVCLFLIYPFFRKEKKKYFLFCFIFGLVYDLFYTNLLFFDGIIFLMIAFIITKIYKLFSVSIINLFIYIILVVVIYEVSFALIIFIFNLVPVSGGKVFYKIGHSLILNILYSYLIYGIIRILPKKWKHVDIN